MSIVVMIYVWKVCVSIYKGWFFSSIFFSHLDECEDIQPMGVEKGTLAGIW